MSERDQNPQGVDDGFPIPPDTYSPQESQEVHPEALETDWESEIDDIDLFAEGDGTDPLEGEQTQQPYVDEVGPFDDELFEVEDYAPAGERTPGDTEEFLDALEDGATTGKWSFATDADSAGTETFYDVSRYHDQERKRRSRSIVRILLISLLLIVVVSGVGVGMFVANVNARLTENVTDELRDQLAPPKQPDDPFYMLLLGVDKDEGRVNDEEYGADEHAYRSDSIMLCRIDPVNVKVTMVSIHRDTLVDLGVNGQQKINAAYSIGGAAYATEVVSTFADVPISHYGEVDLDRFIQIVDVVGGVTVDLPVPVYDPEYTGLDLPAGVQTLDGRTAALLCRCRHGYDAYGDGDRFRAANQRMVFSEVIKKVLASDPATMMNTVSAIADCVTTDLGIAEILDLASQMMTLNVETDIMTGMEPTDGVLIEDGWYEICLVDQWKKMMTRVDQGLPPYDETEGEHDSTAGIAGGVGEEGARAAEAAGTPEYVEPTLSSDTSSGYDGNGYGDAGGYAYDYSTTYYDGGDYSGDTGYTEEYVDYSEDGEVASEEVSYDESGGGGEEVATEEYTGQ